MLITNIQPCTIHVRNALCLLAIRHKQVQLDQHVLYVKITNSLCLPCAHEPALLITLSVQVLSAAFEGQLLGR